MQAYFPGVNENAKDKEYYTLLYKKTKAILESIVSGEENNDVEKIEAEMLRLYKPLSFSGSTSFEIEYDKQFESACTIISQETSIDAHKLTTLQYYLTLENINKQSALKSKAYGKRK